MGSIPIRKAFAVFLIALLVTGGAVSSMFIVEDRARSAEEKHVSEQLEAATCLTDWGVNEGAVQKEVSITGVTSNGVLVKVVVPYAHTVETDEGPLFADTSSEAVYEVSLTKTTRVRGDTISPC